MPNYDGTGPLKRGRVIGRGRGVCKKGTEDCAQDAEKSKAPVRNETPGE